MRRQGLARRQVAAVHDRLLLEVALRPACCRRQRHRRGRGFSANSLSALRRAMASGSSCQSPRLTSTTVNSCPRVGSLDLDDPRPRGTPRACRTRWSRGSPPCFGGRDPFRPGRRRPRPGRRRVHARPTAAGGKSGGFGRRTVRCNLSRLHGSVQKRTSYNGTRASSPPSSSAIGACGEGRPGRARRGGRASGRHESKRSYRMCSGASAVSDVRRRAAASTWTAMAELTLISWNVNGNRRVDEQASAVLAEAPDAVALQEVRRGTLDAWRAEFESAGFAVVATQHLVGERTNFVLTASRHPIVEVAPAKAFSVPFSRAASLDDDSTSVGGAIELLNTHVPDGSGNGWRKVEHFEALYAYIARTHVPGVTTRILCGDFNSPRRALPDGRVITWGQAEKGRLLVDRRRALGPRRAKRDRWPGRLRPRRRIPRPAPRRHRRLVGDEARRPADRASLRPRLRVAVAGRPLVRVPACLARGPATAQRPLGDRRQVRACPDRRVRSARLPTTDTSWPSSPHHRTPTCSATGRTDARSTPSSSSARSPPSASATARPISASRSRTGPAPWPPSAGSRPPRRRSGRETWSTSAARSPTIPAGGGS